MKRRDKRISCQYWSQKKKKKKRLLLILSDRGEDTRGWKARSSKITFKPTSWHPTALVRSTVVARNLSFCSVDLRNMGFIILILKVPPFDRSYGYCTYQKNWFFPRRVFNPPPKSSTSPENWFCSLSFIFWPSSSTFYCALLVHNSGNKKKRKYFFIFIYSLTIFHLRFNK